MRRWSHTALIIFRLAARCACIVTVIWLGKACLYGKLTGDWWTPFLCWFSYLLVGLDSSWFDCMQYVRSLWVKCNPIHHVIQFLKFIPKKVVRIQKSHPKTMVTIPSYPRARAIGIIGIVKLYCVLGLGSGRSGAIARINARWQTFMGFWIDVCSGMIIFEWSDH